MTTVILRGFSMKNDNMLGCTACVGVETTSPEGNKPQGGDVEEPLIYCHQRRFYTFLGQ